MDDERRFQEALRSLRVRDPELPGAIQRFRLLSGTVLTGFLGERQE
ncbi:hypothetical protein ACFY8W_23590 [Streptomyces sp. NPDC012637]